MTDKIWDVVEGSNKVEGKFSLEEVASLVAQKPGTAIMVWKKGLSNWTDPKTLPEFQEIVAAQVAQTQRLAVPPTPEHGPDPAPAEPPVPEPKAAAQPIPSPPPQPGAASGNDESMKKIKEGGKALFDGAVQSLGKVKDASDTRSYLPHINLVDKLLNMVSGIISRERLDSLDEWAKKGGHLGLIASAVLIFLFGVILAIKEGPFMGTMIKYIMIFPVVLILQYMAFKFLDAGKVLIEKSPSSLSSKAFFECVGLLALLAALGLFIGGLVSAIQFKSLMPLGAGIGGTLIMLYTLGVALNTQAVNIHVVDEASAGQEAIGIFSFLMKLLLRLVPFIYGVVNVIGPLMVLFFMGKLMFAEEGTGSFVGAMAEAQFGSILMTALLPFSMYLTFLVYYLLLDVIRSILVLPEKLDKL